MLEKLGQLLDRPLPWFYAVDDALAEVILDWRRPAVAKRRRAPKAPR